MSSISWNEATPVASSDASSGDDELRSFMTNVALGLQPSFYWPGSGGGSAASAGMSQPGNMRMVRSNTVSARSDNGFLQLMPQRFAIEHIGTWTGPLGHSGMLSVASAVANNIAWPQSTHWLLQAGSFSTNTTSLVTQAISFASAYANTPIFASVSETDDGFLGADTYNVTRYVCGIQADSLTTVGFTSFLSKIAGAGSPLLPATFGWIALGVAAL